MPTASFNLINCEMDTSSKSKCDCKSTNTTGYFPTNALSKMWPSDTVKTLTNTISSFKPTFFRLDSTGEDSSHSPVRVITKNSHQNKRQNFEHYQRENTTCSPSNPRKFGFQNNFSVKPLASNYSMKRATSVYQPLVEPQNGTTMVMGSANFSSPSYAPSLLGSYNPFTFLPNRPAKAHPYLHPDSPWLKVNSGYAGHMQNSRHCGGPNTVKSTRRNNTPSKINLVKSVNQNNTHRKTDRHKHFQSEKCASPSSELNGTVKDSMKNCDNIQPIEETSLEKVPKEDIKLKNGYNQQCSSMIDQIQSVKTVLKATPSYSDSIVQKPVEDVETSDEIKKTNSLDTSVDFGQVFVSCDAKSDKALNIDKEQEHANSQEELEPYFKNRKEPTMAATFAQSPSSSELEDLLGKFKSEENKPDNSVHKIHSKDKSVLQNSSNGICSEITAEINGACKDSLTKSANSNKVNQKSCTVCTAYITRMIPECTDFPKSAGCRHSIVLLVRDKSKKVKKHRPKEKHEKPPQSSDKSFIVGVKSENAKSPVNSHVFTFVASDTSDTDESWDSYDDEDSEESKDFCDRSMEDFFPQTLMNPMNFRVQISTLPKPSCTSNRKSSPATSHIDSLNASWNIQIVKSKKTGESKCPAKPPKERKVQFKNDEELVVVNDMCKWSYDDYQAARKGPWEQYARDRERFRRRIQEVDEKISVVLDEKHRNKVYESYFK